MALKTIQTFVHDFPKLEIGEPSKKARNLQKWLLAVTQALEPAGSLVTGWWLWVRTVAENTHKLYLTKPLDQRDQVFPPEAIPAGYAMVEAWLRPTVLACLPKAQR